MTPFRHPRLCVDRSAERLQSLNNFRHTRDSKSQSRGCIGGGGIFEKRIDLQHRVTGFSSEMNRTLAVLFLLKFDADQSIEPKQAIYLSSLQYQQRQGCARHAFISKDLDWHLLGPVAVGPRQQGKTHMEVRKAQNRLSYRTGTSKPWRHPRQIVKLSRSFGGKG
jgi:hypothetical protein